MKYLNHSEIVATYFEDSAKKFDENIAVMSAGDTLHEVLTTASRSRLKNGKLYSHQWRIGKKLLKVIECKLLENFKNIDAAQDFEELLCVVESISQSIKGMGELTAYDIAYRISVFKDIPPKYIYLHAGVRVAVKALGLAASRKVTVSELSSVFSTDKFRLPNGDFDIPHLESCLCTHKEDIANLAQSKEL